MQVRYLALARPTVRLVQIGSASKGPIVPQRQHELPQSARYAGCGDLCCGKTRRLW